MELNQGLALILKEYSESELEHILNQIAKDEFKSGPPGDWSSYIPGEIIRVWGSLTLDQRAIAYLGAQVTTEALESQESEFMEMARRGDD